MLEFTSSIFFWTLVNFIILLFLIHKFALPPFYRLLEDREKKRLDLVAALEKNTQESKNTLDSYHEKLSHIQEEAREILKSAQQEKEQIKKEVFAQALTEKQKILTSIQDELQIEKKRFFEEMKDQAADLIITCSQKIIQKELKPKDHYQIIQQNVDDLEKLIKI